jgi:hypothetical protein
VGKPTRRLFRIHPLRDFAMPSHLAGKLLFLTQVYDFPTRRMRNGARAVQGSALRRRGAVAPSNNLEIALESVSTIYGITAKGAAANSAGPAEFQGLNAITQASNSRASISHPASPF